MHGATDLASVDVAGDASVDGVLRVTGSIAQRRLAQTQPTTITTGAGQIAIQIDGTETFMVDSTGKVTAASVVTESLSAAVIEGGLNTDGAIQAGTVTAGQLAIQIDGTETFSVDEAGQVTASSMNTAGPITAGQIAIGTDAFTVTDLGTMTTPVAITDSVYSQNVVTGQVALELRNRMLVADEDPSPIQVFNNGTSPTFEVQANGSIAAAGSVTLPEAGIKSGLSSGNLPDDSLCTGSGLLAVDGDGKLYVCDGSSIAWVLV